MNNQKWKTKDIPDLKGRIIIVTGGNSGLGYESVKAFAAKGAEVILASRSLERGNKAKAEIDHANGKIVVMELDLGSFASIQKFVGGFKQQYDRLDVLLNNAGIMMTPYSKTKDGLESQNGVNHFGHFALTGQLLDLIKSTTNSRVVNVSSGAHKYGDMDFDNLLFKDGKDYSPMKSYSRSKLSNLLFTYELQRLFEANNVQSIAVAAHPGVSETNLARYVEDSFMFKVLSPLFKLMAQSQERGALPQIRASVDPTVVGAQYYGPNGFREMSGDPVIVPSNKASHNTGDARKLWKISEELTNIKYNFS